MSTPLALIDHPDSATLEIRWNDGQTSHLAHGKLRSQCRCATCEQSRRRAGMEPDGSGVRLREIKPVGEHAVHLIFDDGHDRGIYPWPYLREM